MKALLSRFSAVCGAVRFADVGHVLYISDTTDPVIIPHGFATMWDHETKDWGTTTDDPSQSKVLWTPISATVCEHPKTQMVAIGPWGNVLVDGKGDFHEEVIRDQEKATRDRKGKLLRVRSIGQRAYAAGMGRQAYRRDDANVWTPIDQSILLPAVDDRLLGFFGIDGFSENEIYAGGLQGEIWNWNGSAWRQLDSPTNWNFNDIIGVGSRNGNYSTLRPLIHILNPRKCLLIQT